MEKIVCRIIKKGKRLIEEKKRLINSVYIYFQFKWHNYFNIVVKEQNENPKLIPIIIISFNQFNYLEKLINFLLSNDYKNIIIIDNNSSYKPLLNYFELMKNKIKVYRLNQNFGHLSLWENKKLFRQYIKGYYVLTDPDIVPVSNCPDDFLAYFKSILDNNSQFTKVGFSLKIDDIPDTNMNKETVLKWESQFWRNKLKDGNYKAKIDTTFALYRPNYVYNKSNFFKSCRTVEPYSAIHGGWYIDTNNLTDEQKYYFENSNNSSTWRVDLEGVLKDDRYT